MIHLKGALYYTLVTAVIFDGDPPGFMSENCTLGTCARLGDEVVVAEEERHDWSKKERIYKTKWSD